MIDPFQALLDSALKNNQFPTTSRYYGLATASNVGSDGEARVYIKRRFLPSSEKLSVMQEHQVAEGERLDQLSAQYLGDPEQFWRICDANDAMAPDALVERPGRTLKISLPEGFTGLPNA